MKRFNLYLLIFAGLFFAGCASSSPPLYQPTNTGQSAYTAAFPTRDVSSDLSQIQKSVQRITATATYDSYFTGRPDITLADIRKQDVATLANSRSVYDQSKAGTAISILQDRLHTLMVTAAHIMQFPDTVIVYREGKNIPERKFIESISIKKGQNSFLISQGEILRLNVVDADARRDLALISADRKKYDFKAPPLPIKIGNARNLKLGSFLYIMGYPLGSPMITRGIVSAPNYDNRGSFLTDALFNHGISGGLIIASDDNFKNFEWVGIAVSASATDQQFLIPDPSKAKVYQQHEVYTDTVFVSKQQVINYGITSATPIEQIINFLILNEKNLRKYNLSIKSILN